MTSKGKGTLKEKFKEKLDQLKQILNVLKDKEDMAQKFSFLFQPRNIKTASRLSTSQVEFLADAHTSRLYYEEFEPLKQLSIEVAESTISHKGLGRKDAIEFQLASRPSNAPTAVGILAQSPSKKDKKSKDDKKE